MQATRDSTSPAPKRAGLRKPAIPEIPMGARIPKVLHQTFHSRDLPKDVVRNIARLRAANPEWEYRFYDEAEIRAFIHGAYGADILAHFDALDPAYGAARADLFRYLLIYRRGGVYLDIKSSIDLPLDSLITDADSCLLSHWRNRPGDAFEGWGKHRELERFGGEEFQQWHVAACAGHPLLRAVIERVCRNIRRYNPAIHGVGRTGVLNVTGPVAYSTAIFPLLQRHPHRLLERGAAGFSYSIWDAQAHRTRLGRHYSVLDTPLVPVGRATALCAAAIMAAKALRDELDGRAGQVRAPVEGRSRPAVQGFSAGDTTVMSRVSYRLTRIFWFIWRWETQYDDGRRPEKGVCLSRAAARWSGRSHLRNARAALAAKAARTVPTATPQPLEG